MGNMLLQGTVKLDYLLQPLSSSSDSMEEKIKKIFKFFKNYNFFSYIHTSKLPGIAGLGLKVIKEKPLTYDAITHYNKIIRVKLKSISFSKGKLYFVFVPYSIRELFTSLSFYYIGFTTPITKKELDEKIEKCKKDKHTINSLRRNLEKDDFKAMEITVSSDEIPYRIFSSYQRTI
jgi:hypothetical protein